MRKLGMGTWGCAGVLAIVAAAGCAEESKKPIGGVAAAEGEPTEPGTPVADSPEAARAVARLREKKVLDPVASARDATTAVKAQRAALPGAPAMDRAPRAVIGAAVAERFERSAGALRPVLRKGAGAARAHVALPLTADKTFRLSDAAAGGMKIDVALRGASPKSEAEVADGMVVYRDALDGATVLHRVTAEGTEDFVELERAPASPDVRYDMKIDKSVAGLRLVGDMLEMLDAAGTPRLRVAPPYLVDADGTRHEAKLDVEGCAVDTSDMVPWGRAVTAPGSNVCTVHVSWADATSVKYPALLDPGWTTTASMVMPRFGHGLVTLKNGRALVVGGHTGGAEQPEIYDPPSRTWSRTGLPPVAQQRHYGTATVLDDGDVLFTGGSNQDPRSLVYDIETNTWRLVGAMLRGRYSHQAVKLPDGKVLVVGGYGNGYLASAEIFNPATGLWAPVAPMTTPRYFASAVAIGRKVLVTGGHSGSTVAASAEIYDIDTGVWSSAGTMSVPRYGHFTVLLPNGKVLVGAGWSQSGGQRSVDLYTAGVGWSPTSPLDQGLWMPTASLLGNGEVLVAGGWGCPPGATTNCYATSTAATELYRFDPSGSTWTNAGTMATSRYEHRAVVLGDGSVLVAGGYSNTSGYLASAELFNGVAVAPPTVTSPSANGPAYRSRSVTVAGTGVAGATIKVFDGASPPADGSGALATLVVGANGDFGDQVDIPPGVHTLSFTQTLQGAASTVVTVLGVVVDLPPRVMVAEQPPVACMVPGSKKSIAFAATVDRDPLNPPSALTYSWTENGAPIGSGASPSFDLAIGEHLIKLHVEDSYGVGADTSVSIALNGYTDPPRINVPPPIVAECSPAPVRVPPAQATDTCDGNLEARPTMDAVPGNQLGHTTILYTAQNQGGLVGNATSSVQIVDTTPPSLSAPPSQAFECFAHQAFAIPDVHSTDVCEGIAPVSASQSSIDLGRPSRTTVVFAAMDGSGNRAEALAEYLVQDTIRPDLVLNGSLKDVAECGGAPWRDPGAFARDACSGDLTSRIKPFGAVEMSKVGFYPVVYAVADDAGNTTKAERGVSVLDTTKPELAINGAQAQTLECGVDKYSELGASALDMCNGDISKSVTTTGKVDTLAVASYNILYSAADASGNRSEANRSVTVADTLAPKLVLAGSARETLECGGTYLEPGATANDICVGDLSSHIHYAGAVNGALVGTYDLRYDVADPNGNASSATRAVDVQDTTKPVVSLNGAASQTLECGATYREERATASDTCSGDLTARLVINGGVNTHAVASYTVLYSVVDGASNVGNAQRTINVTDTAAPQITLAGSANETLECGGTYADPGASARDVCTGDLSSRIARSGAVDGAQVGAYTLGYDVADPSGNRSSASRSVSVKDTTAPVVSLNGSAAMRLECGTAFADPGARASDACVGELATSVTGSVNAGAVGTYVLSYAASDPSGNRGTSARSVNVADALAPTLAINGAPEVTLECGGAGYVEQGATASDQCVGNLTPAIVETGLPINVGAVGTTVLNYSVRDPSGNATSATRRVVVRDTLAPTVALKPSFSMWPPNSSYQTFDLASICIASVADQCGGPAATTARIDSIYSDEGLAANNDIVIQSNTSFMVRSARDGKGNGRVYGIAFTVRDAAGNGRQSLCRIFVPHDQSGTITTDSGAAYTITNTN